MQKTCLLLLMGCSLVLTGCQQSIYPDVLLDSNKAVTQDLTQYEMVFEEIMEFPEGKTTEYRITARVPEPGLPVITLDQLPKGAYFDPATQRLSWTPPLEQNSGKPFHSQRILLHLHSTLNPQVKLHRTAMALTYQGDYRE